MFDYQRIVADIQNLLYSGAAPDPDLMRDLGAEYTAACDEVNDRLRQCSQLLQKGLRSEALQFAEREPNLLDAVAQLDFPDLPSWIEYLGQVDFVLPSPLLLDIASDLNQAYAEEAPLHTLLRQHRLLAMGRAPLSSRITVLRRISLVDAMNPAWQADLKAWERTRLQQVVGESDLAYRNRNLDALTALAAELHDPDWMHRPPSDVVAITDHRRQELALAHTHDELKRLAPRLNAAHAAFDVIDGRTARDLWLNQCNEAGLSDSDELAQQVAPALDWLGEEDRRDERRGQFEGAISSLEHALDRDGTPQQALERAYHAVVRFEEGIPEVLARRYAARIRSFELSSRRKFRLRMLAIAGAIILVTGGTATLIVYQLHAREVALAADGLAQLVNEERFIEAQRYYDDLEGRSSDIAHNTRVQEHKARLDSLVSQESDRQTTFAEAMHHAEKAGVDHPDSAALDQARGVARTAREKSQIAEFDANIQAAQRKTQETRDGEFLTEFRTLRGKVEAIDPESGPTVVAQITALKAELESLLSKSARVSPELVGQAKAIKTRLMALDQELLALEKQRQSFQEITDGVGNLERFQGALRRYSATFGETAAARNFDRALEESALWGEMNIWSKFIADTRFTTLGRLNSADARQLLDTGRAITEKYPHHPAAKLFAERTVTLEAIVARLDENKQVAIGNLLELFADPLVARAWMIEMEDGKRYYAREKPVLDTPNASGQVAIEFITGFDLSTKRLGIKAKSIVRVVESPQVPVARSAASTLGLINGSSWESPFFEIVKMLLNAKEMDPVLRMILLRRVVTIANHGSNSLLVGFEPIVKAFDKAPVDLKVAWMLPDDNDARSARQAAREVLEALPAIADIQQRAGKQYREDTRPMEPGWEWYGWLANDARGRWHCFRDQPDEVSSGDLLTYYRRLNEASPTLVAVGTLNKGVVSWRAEATQEFLAGRPLYLRRAVNAPKK